MPLVAGVDGRRGGWSLALADVREGGLDGRGGAARAASVVWREVPGQSPEGFRAVLALAAGAVAVGVDCPIGLPRDAWRPCDLAAKRRLGAAHARVFLAPPREVLAAPTYARARVVARELLGGAGVSAQAYGLRGVVLAVDAVLAAGPPPVPVVEVHPELSFMALAGGALPSKKTLAGRAARVAALTAWAPDAARAAPPGDDGLDALAAAWSAWRHANGTAEVLGGEPGERGAPMRIVV